MKTLILASLVFSFFPIHRFVNDSNSLIDNKNINVATVSAQGITYLLNHDQLSDLIRDVFADDDAIEDYLQAGGNPHYEVRNLAVQGSQSKYYLEGRAILSGMIVLLGLDLTLDGNVLKYVSGSAGYNHTCKGNCCQSCSFVKNSNGEITGCQCMEGCQGQPAINGICNHTIKTN